MGGKGILMVVIYFSLYITFFSFGFFISVIVGIRFGFYLVVIGMIRNK